VAVPSLPRRRETHHDHVGPELPDHLDDVLQDLLPPPLLQRLVRPLGVPEVHGAGEVLLGAVDPAGGEEFLRADDAEQVPLLVADQVLAAVPTRQRKVSSANELLVLKPGKHRRVLVVRMRGHEERGSHDREPLERQVQAGRVEDIGRAVRRDRARRRRRCRERQKQDQEQDETHGSPPR